MRAGRRVCITALILLVAACGRAPLATAPVSVVVSPSRTESQAPPASQPPAINQPPPDASAGRTSSPPPADQTTCRVPFSVISEASGGFITYPGGQRIDDPASMVALPGNTPGQIGVNPGLVYDRAKDRWVPVPLDWLAPGGQVYAYMDFGTSDIRVVAVATGTRGLVTDTGGWYLISTADNGVYAGRLNTNGAWFVPYGGAPQQIVDYGSWQRYSNDALWGIDGGGKVLEHDLSSGLETVWATVSSVSDIVGFSASGEPLVVTGGRLVALHVDGSATILWPGNGDLFEGGRAYADAIGVWFEVDGTRIGEQGTGIYLWTAQQGAQLITSEVVHVMGGCA